MNLLSHWSIVLDPASEEDNDQLTSTGIQQLLDSKELKKKVRGISQSARQILPMNLTLNCKQKPIINFTYENKWSLFNKRYLAQVLFVTVIFEMRFREVFVFG